MVRNVKVKVGMDAQRETGPGEPGISAAGTAAMTLTSQTMIMALNKMQESRDEDKARKEEESSLFKNMGSTQQKLVTDLCTADMSKAPT